MPLEQKERALVIPKCSYARLQTDRGSALSKIEARRPGGSGRDSWWGYEAVSTMVSVVGNTPYSAYTSGLAKINGHMCRFEGRRCLLSSLASRILNLLGHSETGGGCSHIVSTSYLCPVTYTLPSFHVRAVSFSYSGEHNYLYIYSNISPAISWEYLASRHICPQSISILKVS